MNYFNATSNFTGKGYGFPPPIEEPIYKQYKPVSRDLIAVPKPVLYMLMAAAVIVGVAYAIVGHLIKDLALDIADPNPPSLHIEKSLADCVLGPVDDGDKNKNLGPAGPRHPPPNMTANAFHVWVQDEVVVPLPSPDDHSGRESPLAMAVNAAIPYIHSIPSMLPQRALHYHPQSPTRNLHSPTKQPRSHFKDSPSHAGEFQF